MSLVEKIFSCQRCGYCCQGETTVSLDSEDQTRMINALGSTREVICEKYWRVTGNIVQMKVDKGHCIFYNEGCTVHQGRPWRCAQWPLHPSILTDENNFTTIAKSCPGINRELGYTEFCRILALLMEDDNIVC